jgi:hypothetical protein
MYCADFVGSGFHKNTFGSNAYLEIGVNSKKCTRNYKADKA